MAFTSQKQYTIALFLLLALGIPQMMSRKLHETSMRERHEQWMAEYGKVYKDAAEKEKRFLIFKHNVEFIESFNAAANKPYKLGVNHLADLTVEEFKASRNGLKRPYELSTTPFKYENVTAIPAAIDWRTKGAVTSIKDQGQCGKIKKSYKYFVMLHNHHHLLLWSHFMFLLKYFYLSNHVLITLFQ